MNPLDTSSLKSERYARQLLFAPIGSEGQQRLSKASAVIVGCGALGTVSASILCRGGVGYVRIIDRDVVDESNLQRQMLFTEEDARRQTPKAIAAAEYLRRVNSTIRIEPVVSDVHPRNVESLLAGMALVVDATDNLETRFLINDLCVKNGLPWVYGGAIGAEGMAMAIVPGRTACLRCLLPQPPPVGALPTCDRAGVIAPAPTAIAAMQSTMVMRLLMGMDEGLGRLVRFNLWKGTFGASTVPRDPACPACAQRQFPFLRSERTNWAQSLCGRNMVQILPAQEQHLDLPALANELAAWGRVTCNGFLLSIHRQPCEVILFADGRALIKGTSDLAVARSVYASVVGM